MRRFVSWTLVLAFLAGVPVLGADSARVGSYDFNYVAEGDSRARPVQVFDDGRSTFFQFRAGEPVPAIFSHRTGTPQLQMPVLEGPYVRVPELHGRFVLQVGRSQSSVVHVGGGRSDAPQLTAVAAGGATAPYNGGALPDGARLVASLAPVSMGTDDALNRNSYATPRKGDAVHWVDAEPRRDEAAVLFARGQATITADARKAVLALVKGIGPTARVTVIGRDDDTLKEGLDRARADALTAALVRAGVDAGRITARIGVAGVAKGQLWPSNVVVETDKPLVMAVRTERPAPAGGAAAESPAEIVRRLRAGEISPSAAVEMLDRARQAPQAPSAPAAPSAPIGAWAMSKSDETIQRMLDRWAKASGWRLVWEGGPNVPITGDAVVERSDFLQAAEVVVRQLKGAGYRIRATAHSNNVLQITGE